jgi:hypothetical protein
MPPLQLQQQTPPEPITLYSDRRRILLLLLTTLALIAASAFVVRMQPTRFLLIMGYLGVAFFTVVSIAILRLFFDTSPRLIMDEEGLYDRSMKTPKIPWSAIVSMELRTVYGSSFVCLELVDEAERLQALPPLKRLTAFANRSIGFSTFNVNPGALPLSAEEIFTVIAAHVKIYGGNQ